MIRQIKRYSVVTSGQKDAQEEFLRIRRYFRFVAVIALGALVFGAIFYHQVEHLRWLDAFYFCTITLATVGYGDITPHTDAGKLFTIFYVLIGIGIIATFANLLLRSAVARREAKQQRQAKTRS